MTCLFTLDNPVFVGFVRYGTLLVLKTLIMSWITVFYRHQNKVASNPEDMKAFKVKSLKLGDPDVERARRAHLNDLENIPVFLLAALLYISVSPTPFAALWHFRLFTCARILHTVAYVFLQQQPLRGIGYMTGLLVTVSMVIQTIMVVC